MSKTWHCVKRDVAQRERERVCTERTQCSPYSDDSCAALLSEGNFLCFHHLRAETDFAKLPPTHQNYGNRFTSALSL